ncbi:MAG TPA: hypothetical protein VLH59_09180 [Ignavibacteriaceae bacterium]|nr:hypothetical protein [Ignavibacteriaceae bacterium]
MKKLLTYLIISASVFILVSCDKPAPTQLVDDTTDEFEVELLNKDLDNPSFSGSDTSGITQDLTGVTNLISVSGIKITTENRTSEFSLAQAMFFDKSKPIKYSDGRLLAYKTVVPGTIKFNGTEAHIVPYRIRFREGGIPKDTLVGNKYLLYNIFGGYPDPFYFNYNSNVSFEFDPFLPGENISFNIPTPNQINGIVSLTGSKINKNLEANLSWNGMGEKKVFVIIGLMRPGQLQSIPVYRMKTPDDGELKIPGRYLNQLPLDRFEKIVFTFIRSFEGYHGNVNNDLLVSSQSIHSIVIDIP